MTRQKWAVDDDNCNVDNDEHDDDNYNDGGKDNDDDDTYNKSGKDYNYDNDPYRGLFLSKSVVELSDVPLFSLHALIITWVIITITSIIISMSIPFSPSL